MKLLPVVEPLAPVGQIRALVRMSEELFPGEVLEIRIIDPALANAFISPITKRVSIPGRLLSLSSGSNLTVGALV
jgi:hypothetical protein